jgi:hypothetical protein
VTKPGSTYLVRSSALATHLVTRPRQVAAITPGHATFDTRMSQPLSDVNKAVARSPGSVPDVGTPAP